MNGFFTNTLFNLVRASFRKGLTFTGKRDTYEIFGYPQSIDGTEYFEQYKRGDISGRIVDAYPDATWSEPPSYVNEPDNQELSAWEKQLEDLLKSIKFWQNIKQFDKLANLGKFAILFIGFDDGQATNTPVKKKAKPIFLLPIGEVNAKVKTLVESVSDSRFGQPLTYEITVAKPDSATKTQPQTLEVHWSRIIHLAERTIDNPLEGQSILERVWNRLLDLEKVVGSSAEIWWLNGRGGLSIEQEGDAQMTQDDKAEMSSQVDDFNNSLRRTLYLQGLTAKPIQHEIPDPKSNFEVIISLISGATAIPQRILLGSERGELASSSDDDNFKERVKERNANHCEPNILRAFADRLIDLETIEKVEYSIEWPDSTKVSKKDQAEISSKKAQAIVTYANSPTAGHIVPPQQFVEEVLNMEYREEEIDKLIDDENEQIKKDNEELERQGIDPLTGKPKVVKLPAPAKAS